MVDRDKVRVINVGRRTLAIVVSGRTTRKLWVWLGSCCFKSVMDWTWRKACMGSDSWWLLFHRRDSDGLLARMSEDSSSPFSFFSDYFFFFWRVSFLRLGVLLRLCISTYYLPLLQNAGGKIMMLRARAFFFFSTLTEEDISFLLGCGNLRLEDCLIGWFLLLFTYVLVAFWSFSLFVWSFCFMEFGRFFVH